jgi:phosphatidylcholine synthase
VLPNWSGELLDCIIDYITYVLIPAFALYQSGFMGEGLSFLSAAIIVITSAIYYADTGMKTKENFFRGFPIVWNMVVFVLFALSAGEWVSFALVVILAFATFLPINFLHPVRVVRLRAINLTVFLFWCILGAIALFNDLDPPYWTKVLLAITSVYLFAIGFVMQMFPRLGAKN